MAVPYEPGKSIDHYIRAAGGGASDGDIKRAWVQQANGKVQSRRSVAWVFSTTPDPEPGSRVFVPAKNPNAKTDWGQFLGTTAQILGSIVTIALVVKGTQ